MKLVTKKKTFDLSKRTHIMGIVNVTPDSFSDGGSYVTVDDAVAQAVRLEKEGADIIDVGGESTRPGHAPVSEEEEIARVVPIIKAIKEKVSIPISIDTYKAETARQAVEAGAEIINDVWGAKKEPEIAKVAADYDVPIILMHNRNNKAYHSLVDDMKQDLKESIEIAKQAGVPEEHIILDPGIGFAKTAQHNLTVMNHLEQFVEMGYPVLLGTSRKTFIGNILNADPKERDLGTGATTCMGIIKGVQMIRVHNVKVNVEMAKVMDAMVREGARADG
ncbi:MULTISPECIES: dihydropteroate synthase [unclassified Virgibacillus]|uniref:dihydropteroate synthase n=1 Tax=unclassified Virgibacillus TaxID=2620237 RepID=UPI0024DF05A2|nr:dihydropteroate synthase [Virgibacillus sp. LDC-1]